MSKRTEAIMKMMANIVYDNPMISDDMDEKEFARTLRNIYNTIDQLHPDIV